MINRIIKQKLVRTRKSTLLLGPRQVGKSTMMETIEVDISINLADELTFLNHSSNPQLLLELIEANNATTIFIDEIQRAPKMLNSIQAIVDKNKNKKFYLTGSSARKLKSGGANLLPGRLVNFYLGPFVASEFNYKLETKTNLEFGSLPEIYLLNDNEERKRILKSYSANYIKEEIKAEALVRNLDSFARFFNECTKNVSQFIDYSKLANHSKISRHSIPRYFEILEDTLIAERIFPLDLQYHDLDLVKHPRFFFFDNGVYNGLLGNFIASSDRIGLLAEQLVFSQLKHSAWAKEKDITIYSFRTRQGIEVDFVVKIEETLYAIEVKNSENLISEDFSGLDFFKDNVGLKNSIERFVFHMGKKSTNRGDIKIVPWQEGLQLIGL